MTGNTVMGKDAIVNGIEKGKNAIEHFENMRFGVMFHWGPAVQRNAEISWSKKNRQKYESCYKTFDPKKLDTDQWVALLTMIIGPGRWGTTTPYPQNTHPPENQGQNGL